VARHGLGRVVGHRREIPEAVAALRRDPAERERVRDRLAALPPNRAVDEVLEILDSVIGITGTSTG
jgi:hypothetical protein